jgi:hypothetical protein
VTTRRASVPAPIAAIDSNGDSNGTSNGDSDGK